MDGSYTIFSTIKWAHQSHHECANDVVNGKSHPLLSTGNSTVNIPDEWQSLGAVLFFFLASLVYGVTLSRSFSRLSRRQSSKDSGTLLGKRGVVLEGPYLGTRDPDVHKKIHCLGDRHKGCLR